MISLSALAAGAWTAALIAVPAAMVVAGLLRVLPCRPATRHATWAALLLALLVLPALPPPPTPPLAELAAAADFGVPGSTAANRPGPELAPDGAPDDEPDAVTTATTETTTAPAIVVPDSSAHGAGGARDRTNETAPTTSPDDADEPRRALSTGQSVPSTAEAPREESRSRDGSGGSNASFGVDAGPYGRLGGAGVRPGFPSQPRAPLHSERDPAGDRAATSPASPTSSASPAVREPRDAIRMGPRASWGPAGDEASSSTPSSEPAMRRPRDLAGFAAPLAGTPNDRGRRSPVPADLNSAAPGVPGAPGAPEASDPRAPSAAPATSVMADAARPEPSAPAAGATARRVTPRVHSMGSDTAAAVHVPTGELEAPATSPPVSLEATPVPSPAPSPLLATGEPTPAVASLPDAAGGPRDPRAPGPVVAWIARLVDVRDAVVRVPMIPTVVWAGGAAMVALIALVRCIAFRRRLDAAVPADGTTRALVLAVAGSCGVDRAPDVRMTDDTTSPLLWCGPGERPMLVLPRRLWAELDPLGRRAVVAHELAHLRRRDHVGCWLSLLVGCLYWWHPVVWFIRRRLEEEADHSCDAWVTTLLPEARRAYATALLRARAMSSGPVHAPGPAMSLTTNRTRRFARRLTMVMSRTTHPNASVGGVLLAVGVAAGSWLASPALAGPEQEAKPAAAVGASSRPATLAAERTRRELEAALAALRAQEAIAAAREQKASDAAAPRASTAARGVGTASVSAPAPTAGITVGRARFGGRAAAVAPDAPTPPAAPALPGAAGRPGGIGVVPPAAPAPPAPPALRARPALPALPAPPAPPSVLRVAALPGSAPRLVAAGDRSDGDRLDALEARIARMESMLERMVRAVEARPGAVGAVRVPRAPEPPQPPQAGQGRRAPQAPGGAFFEARGFSAPALESAPMEILIRTEKGEALWTLLSRDDVAIRVSRDGDRILVHGPERDRMLVEAFVAMVGSDDESYETMDIAASHQDAVWEFMARSDVPVWVRRADDGLELEGTALEHLVFQAFVDALADDGGADAAVSWTPRAGEDRLAEADARRRAERMRAEGAQARELAGVMRAQAEEARRRAMQWQQRAHEHELSLHERYVERARLDAMQAELDARSRLLEAEADRRRAVARELETTIDRMAREQEELEAAMEELEGALEEAQDEDAPRERIATLRRELREVRRAAERTEREFERAEASFDEHESHGEHLEDEHHEIELLREELEVRREELEVELEELEQVLEELRRARPDAPARPGDVSPAMIADEACTTECATDCTTETTTECATETTTECAEACTTACDEPVGAPRD